MSKVIVLSNQSNSDENIIPRSIEELGFVTIRLNDARKLSTIAKKDDISCIVISTDDVKYLTEKEPNILENIKKDKDTYIVPVLGVFKDPVDYKAIEHLLQNGMDDYIIQPVNNLELKTRIKVLTKLEKVTKNTIRERKFIYTVLDNIEAMILVTDLNYNIIGCNDYTSRFFCDKGILIGRNFTKLALDEGDYYDNVLKILNIFVESPSRIFRPEIVLKKDKNEVEYRWSISKDIISDGSNILIFVGQDTSETRRHEALIEKLLSESKLKNMQMEEANTLLEIKNNELYELNQLKTEYMSIASHDLRSPISQIMGLSQLFLRSKKYTPTDPQRHLIEKILESAEFQLSLVSDILDVTRIESGNMKADLVLSDLNKLIAKSVSVVEELAKNKGITILIKETEKTLRVKLDELKIQQVINNLLINAVKFTNEGGNISISTSIEDDNIFVSVKDTGIGIKKEDVKNIFKKFNKNNKVGTMGERGTGLGLSICKKFVELHGGTINVESTFGEGSNFTFNIPVS